MWNWSLAIALICAAQGGGNLLANPGFESLQGAQPASWDLFLMPQLGSSAGLDDQMPGSGQYAVMLHHARPYDKEPVNNWSQNILGDLGGKTLRLSGRIRTQDATEAALWIQCWTRPGRLLSTATTSKDAPVRDTQAWTPVSVDVDVPAGTDFVVVRCVLLGTGTAWFDDLQLAEPGEASKEAPADTPKAPQASSARLDDLRATNAIMEEQIWTLYEEVERLRAQVNTLKTAEPIPALPPPAPVTEKPPVRVPPLVPHGARWEDLP